jgi:putative protease
MVEPSYNVNDYRVQLPKGLPTVDTPTVWVRVRNLNQLVGIGLSNVNMVVVPLESILSMDSIPTDLVGKLIVQPPRYIVNERDTMELLSKVYGMGVSHLMCNNLAYIRIGSSIGYTLHGDFGLNIANSLALDSLKTLGCVDGIVSFELKLQQVNALKKSIPIGLEVYGKLPLMLVRNCPIKNEVGCKLCKHYISDRTNRKFPVYCANGYSEVFNAETISIADKLSEVGNVDYYVLSFVDETPLEVSTVLEGFAHRKKMGTTNGLYLRGVI